MNMKIITLIALALGCLAVFGIADMSDDSDAAIVDPSTGTQVGDLYYTFSGDEATVVGISSSISSATSITIPDTVESGGTTYNVVAIGSSSTITDGVFYNMTALESITLPANLTTIGDFAFYRCSSLALTSLPSGVTSLGKEAFENCSSLALTSIPSGITILDVAVFKNCSSLAVTSIPSGVTEIRPSAFNGCTAIESLTIPLSVTTVGNYSFANCPNLTLSIDMTVQYGSESETVPFVTGINSDGAPTRVITLPSAFGNHLVDGWRYGPTNYNNGDSVTVANYYNERTIYATVVGVDFGACGDNLSASMLFADYDLTITGTGAMYDYTSGSPAPWNSYATSIVSLDLPEGMTTYGDYAFYGCTGLSGTLTIPSAITHVGDSAFYDCGYSAMIIEGSPTLTDVSDPTFGSADGESFKKVLNLGDTVIEAGQYGLPDDAVVSDCIPLLGYVAPTSFSETVQKEGAAYDLMSLIPVIIILAVLVMAATAVIKRD